MIKNSLHFFGIAFAFLLLTSCEIVQEIRFDEDGSGKYSLGFDMSEMMKMGGTKKDSGQTKQMDTLIRFSDFLEEKKDSIQKLSKEKREKLAELKDFDLYMKVDSTSNQLRMKLGYQFKNIADMNNFAKKLEDQDVKELDLFKGQLSDKASKTKEGNEGKKAMPNFNEVFETTFTSSSFSRKITDKALKGAEEKKDTTMTKDNPMADLIRFKQRYIFPFKIKKVGNNNAKILSDFKGIEIEANMYELTNDPKFFDLEVEFENE